MTDQVIPLETERSQHSQATGLSARTTPFTQPNEKDLEKLQDENKLLKGKIRGYQTLSELFQEAKEECRKLTIQNKELIERITMEDHYAHKETNPLDPSARGKLKKPEHQEPIRSSLPPNVMSTSAHKSTIGTNDLFPPSVPMSASFLSANQLQDEMAANSRVREIIPMQESVVLDNSDANPFQISGAFGGLEETKAMKSATRLSSEKLDSDSIAYDPGQEEFVRVESNEAAVGSPTGSPDLMDFLTLSSTRERNVDPRHPPTRTEPREAVARQLLSMQIEHVAQALPGSSQIGQQLSRIQKDIADVEQRALLADKYKDAYSITAENMKQTQDQNKLLLQKIQKLEHERDQLSPARSMTSQINVAEWVHVQKREALKSEDVMLESGHSSTPGAVAGGIQDLQEKNKKLTIANQQWVTEWNRMQAQYEGQIASLQHQVDALNRDISEAKVQDEKKQQDFDKMLMNVKKRCNEEEMKHEEAESQLADVTGQLERLRAEYAEQESALAEKTREKQAVDAELAVLKRQTSRASESSSPKTTNELLTEIAVMREQLTVFQEDFDRERHDRALAQSGKDELQKQLSDQKKKLKHQDLKVKALDKQIKDAETRNNKTLAENGRLQQEVCETKNLLRREREANAMPRPMMNTHGYMMQPVVQSAGLHQPQGIHGIPAEMRQRPTPPPQPFIMPQYMQQGHGHMPQTSPGHHVYAPVPPGNYNENYPINRAQNPPELLPGAWTCGACTYVNYPTRTVCEICGTVKMPGAEQTAVYAGYPSSEQSQGQMGLRPRGEPPVQGFYPHYGMSNRPGDLTTDSGDMTI